MTLDRRSLLNATLIVSLCALTSCAPKERVFPVRSGFFIEGKIIDVETNQGAKPDAERSFFWINSDGVRKKVEEISFDNATGQFRFEFQRDNLLTELGRTRSELHASMGLLSPLERLSNIGYSRNELGYIRFEYMRGQPPNSTGSIASYAQAIAGFTMSASFNNTSSLNVSSVGIQAQTVGAALVTVKNADGTAIPNAHVSVLPLVVIGTGEADLLPLDFRADATFTPITALTDAQGNATVWPIPIGKEQQYKYQVVAEAEGYCPKVNAPRLFSNTTELTELSLESCPSENAAKNQIEFTASYSADTFTLPQDLGKLPKGTGCTNKESIDLNLKSLTPVFRSLLVQVHEGEDTAAPVVLTQVVPVFSDQVSVSLPSSFANGTTQSGRFFINIKAQLTELDRSKGMSEYSFGLVGDKRVSSFTADAQDFKIRSSAEVENVISGLPDSKLSIDFLGCDLGQKIGASINNDDGGLTPSEFIPCVSSGTLFERDQIRWKDVFPTKTSGFKRIRYFYADRYGNKSGDDTGLNKVNLAQDEIYVDSDPPNAEDIELGVRTAIIDMNSAVPFDGSGEVQITPATLSNFKFAFRLSGSTLQCFTVPNSNPSEPEEGSTLSRFFIGTPRNPSEMFDLGAPCATGSLPLTTDSVVFPNDPLQPAILKVTIFDQAGNLNSGELEIPACTGSANSKDVCWKNDDSE